jgi:O-acetyl-ADP-ribose deacetylase (regulator of RNase III)
MIEHRQGNILEADTEALVNTVNCVGVMGKGIALQFKLAYPENFRKYERACRAGEVQPGRMLVVSTDRLVNPRYIINFPTKRHWKGKARLEDIRAGLVALIEEVRRLDLRSIAVPPLGCGNGGLNWSEVRPMIEDAFAALPEVRVKLFAPQAAPEVEAMPVATDKPPLTRARALLLHLLDRYRSGGYRLSRLEVQKLAYFLQAAGEPLRLRYVKHMYGPYADNLNHVLQLLEGHYVRGYGDRSGKAQLALVDGALEAAQTELANDSEAMARLECVSRLIEGFETPYGMELLATAHWVATNDSPPGGSAEADVVTGVQAWSARKRDRFKPAHIRAAWQRLRDEGWLATAEEAGAIQRVHAD